MAPIKSNVAPIAAAMLLLALTVVFGESPLDAPAEKKITVGSEIERGYHAVNWVGLEGTFVDQMDRMLAVVSRNKEQNKDTDGFLLGANFAMWHNCDIAYKVGRPEARKFAELSFSDWRNFQRKIGIDDRALCDIAHVKYEIVAPRIALYGGEHVSQPTATATPIATATVVARDPNFITLTRDVSITIPYGIIGLQAGAKLRAVSRSGETVRIRYTDGSDYDIPVSATDLK